MCTNEAIYQKGQEGQGTPLRDIQCKMFKQMKTYQCTTEINMEIYMLNQKWANLYDDTCNLFEIF